MSDYYASSNDPSTGSSLVSSVLRSEYSAIAAGFAKIAPYTSANNRLIFINSGATAQTTDAELTYNSITNLLTVNTSTFGLNTSVAGTLGVTGVTTLTALTTSGLIIANAGISIPTGQSITGTGTASVTGFQMVSGTVVRPGFATTATAAGTTTLTAASAQIQEFTGTANQTIVLPDVTTLTAGHAYDFINNSTGALTINSSGANLVQTLGAGARTTVTCILASGTSAASWAVVFSLATTAAGGINVPVSALGNTYSATYTPALTNATNIAASTMKVTGYMRVGNYVFVGGYFLVDPTATGAVAFDLSVPVASTFAAAENLGGTMVSQDGYPAGTITANTTTATARFNFSASSLTNQVITFSFGYQVI